MNKSLMFISSSAVKKQQVSTAAGAVESAKKRLVKSGERLDACNVEVRFYLALSLQPRLANYIN